uniref:Methyltransferase domain-containing protein n=1 Tax=Branchiostoma floridae TaxID=7739 RepID=C3XSQ2_BRAFL|eukprot:XP_002612964.1 hypothetical protein BRAFLDRAFT_74749 [Branchiostoma floridae]
MAAATKEAAAEDLSNTFFAAHDAAKLPSDWSNKFEYVTAFDAIHDVAFPEEALQEVRRILKPGGLFSLVEIKGNSKISENVGNPFGPVMYSTSLLHCVPVSMHFKGKGLGTIWGKQSVCTMLQESGLRLLGVMDVPETIDNSTRVGRILQGLSTFNKFGTLEQTAVGCAAFIFISLFLLFVLDSCVKKWRNREEEPNHEAAGDTELELENIL